MSRLWSERLGLGLLLVVAVFSRVYHLREIPWGINNDVAWNGLYALRILDGEAYTPFTAEAWGKETFFFHLVAACFKAFGAGELTLLIPSIVAGVLTVVAFHAVSRDLFDGRTARVGAFVLAAMAWHVTLSRTGYRAILSPLFLLLLLGAFFRAIDASSVRARLAWFTAAGLALGLGHHSYFSFRVATPLLIVLLAREAWTGNGVLRRNASGLALMAAAAAILVLPLIVYAARNPEIFFARTGHLWIGARVREAGSWTPFWENLRDNLLMFHYRARVGNFFNNDWPILSAPLGLFFLAGLAALLAGARRRGPFVALAVGFFAHLPALLSAPDATRSLMVTLTVAWAAAAAVETALRLPWPARARPALAAALTLGLVGAELHFYFHRLGRDPAAQFAYAGIHTAIGRRVAELAREHLTFVSHGHNFETTQFLWRDVPSGRIVGLGVEPPGLVAPEALLANLEVALAADVAPGQGRAFVIEAHPANEPLLRRVREALPGGDERAHVDERFGGLAYYSYVVVPTPR
jgi:4-amino-4-deoxy-L-arabinose transferase-like glycosyltransferase